MPIVRTGASARVLPILDAGRSLSFRSPRSPIPVATPRRADGSLHWLPPPSIGTRTERLFLLLEDANLTMGGRLVAALMITTICVSTAAFVVETMPEMRNTPAACATRKTVQDCEPVSGAVFADIEKVCIAIFTVDYVLRIGTAAFVRPSLTGLNFPTDARAPQRVAVLRRYALSPLNVIDFLAIAPFYIERAIGSGGGQTGIIRVLRLARVLRLFKMGKHNKGLKVLAQVLTMSAPAMQILIFFSLLITVLFASLLYFVEGTDYSVAADDLGLLPSNSTTLFVAPDAANESPVGVYVRQDAAGRTNEITPVHSIPWCFWWVLVTMTTVGYGDLAPTTSMGKLVGIALFYVGIIFLALPITILGTNFEAVYSQVYGMAGESPAEADDAGACPTATDSADASEAAVTSPGATPRATATPRDRYRIKRHNDAREDWSKVREERRRERRRNSLALGDFLRTPWVPRQAGLLRTCFVLFEDPSASRLGKLLSLAVMGIIFISCTTFCMETMPSMRSTKWKDGNGLGECVRSAPSKATCEPQSHDMFAQMEAVFIVIFTAEYLARVLTVHAVPASVAGLKHDRGGLRNTLSYCSQALNIVDIVAILPWYIAQATGSSGGGVAVLRVLRLVRVFRIFRVGKYATGAHMVLKCLSQSLPALSILFFVSALMSVLFSSGMYFAEGTVFSVHEHWLQNGYPNGVYVRPHASGIGEEPSPFRSIPSAFWWFFTTTTTVGYGDFFPTTTAGKIVGMLNFLAGIILIALPVTIIGGNFSILYLTWMAEESNEAGQAGGGPLAMPPSMATTAEFNGIPIDRILSGDSDELSASTKAQYAKAAAAAVAALTKRYGLAAPAAGVIPSDPFAAFNAGRKTPTELYEKQIGEMR